MLQIITDSASDITLKDAAAMGIHVVPLRIQFADGICPQETDADFDTFYRRLAACQTLPVTSQPALEDYLSLYEQAKAQGDPVLVITLSSGLSSTIQNAGAAKTMCGYEPIYILDSRQAIIAQRILVEKAVALRDQGMDAETMLPILEDYRDRITVSGVLDTLTNLKKGGRIPASLAALGNTLHIKPVIALQDSVLKMVGKALGREAGWRHLHKRFEQFPPDPESPIYFGYTSNRPLTEQFMAETVKKYGLQSVRTKICPVGGVIGTHVGNNCVAICYVAREKVL